MSITSEGREAKTFFRVKEIYNGFSLVECELESGRTHQIRVHMQYINHAILGDPLYRQRSKIKAKQLMLQSFNVAFIHPITDEAMDFTLELRHDFLDLINEWSK